MRKDAKKIKAVEQVKTETAEKPMPRLNRQEIIERVIRKYGHRRWKVELAADRLFGVEHPQSASTKKDESLEEETTQTKKIK